MAKAALGISNPELAEITGLHRNTLNRADRGEATEATWALLRVKFEAKGVKFLDDDGDGPGVRFRPLDDDE